MGAPIRRIGLTPDPPGGWPFDQVFVGVATLRILRELVMRDGTHRPWDLHLRTGVSPQGAADALRRLEGLGLVRSRPGYARGEASRYWLVRSHPFVGPLADLFVAEDDAVEGRRKELRRSGRTPWQIAFAHGGSGRPARGSARGESPG